VFLLEKGAHGAAVRLQHEGFTNNLVHKVTVIRAARRVATQQGTPIHAGWGKPDRRLNRLTMHRRLQFCMANHTHSWGNVMFTYM